MASRPLSCHAFDFSGCHLPWIGAIRLGRASVEISRPQRFFRHHSCLGLISLAMEQLLHRHRDHRPQLVSSFTVQQEHPEACGVSSPDVEDTSISVHYQSILSLSSKRGG